MQALEILRSLAVIMGGIGIFFAGLGVFLWGASLQGKRDKKREEDQLASTEAPQESRARYK